MFDVPSREDVAKVVISADVVLENVNPTLVPREPRKNDSQKNETEKKSRKSA
jgi:ATP-dependent Clp protease ATP-binding subunit ClpX